MMAKPLLKRKRRRMPSKNNRKMMMMFKIARELKIKRRITLRIRLIKRAIMKD